MFKKILLIVTVVVAGFLGFVAMQPDSFKITRSISISAPASAIFPHVNNFHKWQAWSPWAKLDPSMKLVFEGPESGVGASHGWIGNDKVGEGNMTIIQSQAPELVVIKLDFFKPMKSVGLTEISFKQEGKATTVNWSMTGKSNFISRIFCFFVNMDKMVGADFEKALNGIKEVVEAEKK